MDDPETLEEQRDRLRDKLVFLSGKLKALGFDFTETVRLLLIDTAPATPEQNSRLTRRVERLQTGLDELQAEKKTALVSAAAPSATPAPRKRRRPALPPPQPLPTPQDTAAPESGISPQTPVVQNFALSPLIQ